MQDLYARLPKDVVLPMSVHDAIYDVLRQTKPLPVYAPLSDTEIMDSPASDLLWQQSAAGDLQGRVDSVAKISTKGIVIPPYTPMVFEPGMRTSTNRQANGDVSISPTEGSTFTEVQPIAVWLEQPRTIEAINQNGHSTQVKLAYAGLKVTETQQDGVAKDIFVYFGDDETNGVVVWHPSEEHATFFPQ